MTTLTLKFQVIIKSINRELFFLLQDDGNCPVVALDSTKDGFFKEIEVLDKMEPRTCDTCHVFYVRAGQSHHKGILANVVSIMFVNNVNLLSFSFYKFLFFRNIFV